MTFRAVTFPERPERSVPSMAEGRSARKRASLPGRVTDVVSYRVMLLAAGIPLAALLAAFVPLTMASHDLHQSADGTTPVVALALAAVGMVVASRLPRNPIGWLLVGSGLATMLSMSCPVRPCRQVEVLLRRVPVATLGFGHGHCLLSAWNSSWNDAPDNPNAASAVSAMRVCHWCSWRARCTGPCFL